MPSNLEAIQSLIDVFDKKINEFVSFNDVKLAVVTNKSGTGLSWKDYSFNLRNDLPPYGLKLDESQGVLSYCTDFTGEVMGERQAIFNGHKRLVLVPSNPREIRIETPEDVWFFISSENEMDRFIVFLNAIKYHARPFF